MRKLSDAWVGFILGVFVGVALFGILMTLGEDRMFQSYACEYEGGVIEGDVCLVNDHVFEIVRD